MKFPREDLIRALAPSEEHVELRSEGGTGMPTMAGFFARFDEWTEIDSVWEGNFMERVAKGAFRKTFKELGERIKVLFEHGHDPQIGQKVLGRAEVLREKDEGAYYEVPLLDTDYNRELVPGLEAGVYGASFRFSVIKEDLNQEPGRSRTNPKGLPERTILEARVPEFGPVTFPAYEGATAGLRSLTDEYLFSSFLKQPDRLRELLDSKGAVALDDEKEPESEADATPDDETSRSTQEPEEADNREEDPPWLLKR